MTEQDPRTTEQDAAPVEENPIGAILLPGRVRYGARAMALAGHRTGIGVIGAAYAGTFPTPLLSPV